LLRPPNAVDEGCTSADEPLSRLITDEQLTALRRVFDRLPPVHRRLIEMAYDLELSHSEIARRLHQPLGTVKSRIRQALIMMRGFGGPNLALLQLDPDGACSVAPASDAFTTVETDAEALHAHMAQRPILSVLVVDDDPETVRLITAVLRKFQMRAEARMTAEQGLAALEESWPDVMISDLNMPEEDGYSLIGKARAMANERGLPLRAAAFTSWSSEHERSRALLAGFDLYINKPVHPVALISAIATLSR
jgi:CheY-like chemotaxis protein